MPTFGIDEIGNRFNDGRVTVRYRNLSVRGHRDLGVEVRSAPRTTGVDVVSSVPGGGYAAVIDLSTAREAPARAVEIVEPGGTVVLVGIAEEPSVLDTRRARQLTHRAGQRPGARGGNHALQARRAGQIEQDRGEGRIVLDDEHERIPTELVAIVKEVLGDNLSTEPTPEKWQLLVQRIDTL